ncbi:(2Fe-2S)-binding protein [Boseaceae bacterium BT-24-1]|nr:(2Fe-2S)-binding protein [Boseaceae bacterium BT-24-1]
MSVAQFKRLKDSARRVIHFSIDGEPCTARAGDSVLSAMMLTGRLIRQSDIDAGFRAGFCLMGACQDCWVWLETGGRIRACTTPIEDGLSIKTNDPDFRT